MSIAVLSTVSYSGPFTHRSLDRADPSWGDVDTAIRSMDAFAAPLLFLRQNADVDDSQQLEIIGGEGAYWVAAWVRVAGGGETQVVLVNPAGDPEREISVWTSDQGLTEPERYVCRSLDVVLKAARYWFDHGEPDPGLAWERR